MDVFTTSLRFADVLLKGPSAGAVRTNAGVLPRLMSQLMVFSCLISVALSVSVGSVATGEGSRLPLGCGGPSECSGLCVMSAEVEGRTSAH